jgi:predicted phosphodiesterase
MVTIAILSDAHLLMQAEWIEDERRLTVEGEEVLENFQRAISLVKKDKPEVIVLAGDMFDYRTKGRQRVAHREGEKYMIKIRSVFEQLIDEVDCKIYALKGNHDSEPVLRSTEKALKGKFIYSGNRIVTIGNLNAFFMNSHYIPGIYVIPLEEIPKKGNLLFMHESLPLFGIPAPSEDNLRDICKRFNYVFDGHMHLYQTRPLKISNLFTIPAFIPSREIKNSWMLRYTYPDSLEPEVKETSPFGYLLFNGEQVEFRPYNPLQVIVHVEIKGDKTDDFISGIREIYDCLLERKDRNNLRVWVKTNADPITIDRVFWPIVSEYEVQTMDIISVKREVAVVTAPEPEFGEKAFTRDELIERVLSCLKDKQVEIARNIFDEIFTSDYLLSKKPDERSGFKKLIEIISRDYEVSEAFQTRAWELAKRRGES